MQICPCFIHALLFKALAVRIKTDYGYLTEEYEEIIRIRAVCEQAVLHKVKCKQGVFVYTHACLFIGSSSLNMPRRLFVCVQKRVC